MVLGDVSRGSRRSRGPGGTYGWRLPGGQVWRIVLGPVGDVEESMLKVQDRDRWLGLRRTPDLKIPPEIVFLNEKSRDAISEREYG